MALVTEARTGSDSPEGWLNGRRAECAAITRGHGTPQAGNAIGLKTRKPGKKLSSFSFWEC
ncbi:MAG: hypothetical protein ACI38O_11825 [Fibrobacter intestinalis]|uniref:hypothetical protein n=1 Tax=Fibrobacter intestinalis TaxID=28122 RepID=UPI003F0D09CD